MDVRGCVRFDLMNVCIISYGESARLSKLKDGDDFAD